MHRISLALLLIVLAGAALPPAIAAADVTEYATARIVGYTQTSDASPTGPGVFAFQAIIVSDINNELQSPTVSFVAPPPTTYGLNEALKTRGLYDADLKTRLGDALKIL